MADGKSGKTKETKSPIERGSLGTGMMSDKGRQARDLEDDVLTRDANAKAGGDIEGEMKKSGAERRKD